jgi:HK97 family phage prohead protease
MNIERKFIDLKDLTVTDEGPGHISGYRAVFNEIDEGGDLIVPGFFKDSITEYLEAGFTAHSHDWDFDKAVGYPMVAKEDDHGFFVDSEFHSTPDAQAVRTKAVERKKAGKRVGFSFGYSVSDRSYIEAKDYKEQLPLYVKADRLQANMQKAQKFDRIRILKKGEVIEDSIVTAPMNKLAMATAVKSDKVNVAHIVDSKGMLAEEMAQTTPSTWEIDSALRRVVRKIAETAKDSNVTGVVMDWKAKIAEAFNEYPPTMIPLVTAQIEEFLTSSDDEFYLKEITASESFESFDKAAPAALKKFIENMQRNHEARVKEGRVLSTSNRATVQKCKDSLTALMGDLDALLAMSEPKPKEKEIDVDTLRTQSLRMQSLAIRALA